MSQTIIYIRHGEDKRGDYKYDEKLTSRGKRDAKKVAKELIDTYGIPDAIYCSPFYRTRQTRHQMLKVIGEHTDREIVKVTDHRLSRYFTDSEKKNPDIRSDTRKKKVPIYESWDDFKERVYEHVDEMENSDHEVIWCIGHTLIIKHVAKYKNIKRSSHIEYLDKVVLTK